MKSYILKVYYQNGSRPVRLFFSSKSEANAMRDELRAVREVRKVEIV
jgi:hypothetical protein